MREQSILFYAQNGFHFEKFRNNNINQKSLPTDIHFRKCSLFLYYTQLFKLRSTSYNIYTV